MGIVGLLPLLKAAAVRVHVSAYRGQRVAIDAYGWLHRGAYNCAAELAQGVHTDGFVRFCIHRARQLRHAGVEPVFVFDGSALPAKRLTEDDRERRRDVHRTKGLEFLKQKRLTEALAEFQKCVNITAQIAHQLIEALRLDRFLYVVAPYEADAQIAYLFRIGAVSAVIAEDSDMLAFGCQRVLFKMDKEGYVDEVVLSKLAQSDRLNLAKFTPQKFQQLCVLSGCDYLASIHGVGPLKAAAALNRHHDALHAINSLLISAGASDAERKLYRHGFRLAVLAFRHQTVFDPATGTTVPLFPITEELSDADREFIGAQLPHDVARRIAIGNLDPHTLKPLDNYAPGPGDTPYEAILQHAAPNPPSWEELMLAPFKPKPSPLPAASLSSVLDDLPEIPFLATPAPAPTGPLKQATLLSFGVSSPSPGSASRHTNTTPAPSRLPPSLTPRARPAANVEPLTVNSHLRLQLAGFAYSPGTGAGAGRASASPAGRLNDDEIDDGIDMVAATPSPASPADDLVADDSAAAFAAAGGSPLLLGGDLLDTDRTYNSALLDSGSPLPFLHDSPSPVLLPATPMPARAAAAAAASLVTMLVPESPERPARHAALPRALAQPGHKTGVDPDGESASPFDRDRENRAPMQSSGQPAPAPAPAPASVLLRILTAPLPVQPTTSAPRIPSAHMHTLPLHPIEVAPMQAMWSAARAPPPASPQPQATAKPAPAPAPTPKSTTLHPPGPSTPVSAPSAGRPSQNRFAQFKFRPTDPSAQPAHPYHFASPTAPGASSAKRPRVGAPFTPPSTPAVSAAATPPAARGSPDGSTPAERMAAFLQDQMRR